MSASEALYMALPKLDYHNRRYYYYYSLTMICSKCPQLLGLPFVSSRHDVALAALRYDQQRQFSEANEILHSLQ